MTSEQLWAQFAQPYIDAARPLADRIRLAVICCVAGETAVIDDYDEQSIDTRFYSPEEAEHFLGSLRGAGFTVIPFFSEDAFIKWILAGKHLSTPLTPLLAISTGASFSGIGAKTLIPAFCRLHGIPIAGPDPHSASIARHKFHANLILRSLGDVAPRTRCFLPDVGWINDSSPPYGMPVILKLTHEGASIGLDDESVMESGPKLQFAIEATARQYRQMITVQEYIPGLEVEVPLICAGHPHALLPVGLSLQGDHQFNDRILTYDISRSDGYDFWDFSKEASPELVQAVKQTAEACAEILGLRDLSRIDMRIDTFGRAKVIDISTSPYICPHSSFAYAASACGAAASDLPILLLGLACARNGLATIEHNPTNHDSSQI